MNLIKKIPPPICGVMLAWATLGNLLQSYSEEIRYLCGIISGIFLILILLKIILFPKMVAENLKNPVTTSVSAPFPMGLMLLSVYVKPFIGRAAFYLWMIGVLLHIALIVYFTVHFIFRLQISQVFASYFVVYAGFQAAAITAPAYEQTGFGALVFWFSLTAFLCMLVLISFRYIKFKDVPPSLRPLICIYTSPTSLCIAGYVQSVNPKSYGFLMGMLALALILYVFSLIKAIGFIKEKTFYPSFASFTFPFAISAVAVKQAAVCAAKLGKPVPILTPVIIAETIIAAALILYTTLRYITFLISPAKT